MTRRKKKIGHSPILKFPTSATRTWVGNYCCLAAVDAPPPDVAKHSKCVVPLLQGPIIWGHIEPSKVGYVDNNPKYKEQKTAGCHKLPTYAWHATSWVGRKRDRPNMLFPEFTGNPTLDVITKLALSGRWWITVYHDVDEGKPAKDKVIILLRRKHHLCPASPGWRWPGASQLHENEGRWHQPYIMHSCISTQWYTVEEACGNSSVGCVAERGTGYDAYPIVSITHSNSQTTFTEAQLYWITPIS